jgi:hypothetical protein
MITFLLIFKLKYSIIKKGGDMEKMRGEWQKSFVLKLVKEVGLTHTDAMEIMGLVCEERQTAYMEGYVKGYNDNKEKV